MSLKPPTFGGVDTISAGTDHSLAVGIDNTAYAWGSNHDGDLGTGHKVSRSLTADRVNKPAGTPSDFRFTKVSAGARHSLAIGSDGNAYAWGNGLGTAVAKKKKDSRIPIRVATPDGVSITQVSAGAKDSLAIGSDGNAYAWGYNTDGMLGNNSTKYSITPVQVIKPVGAPSDFRFTKVSAGARHSLAIGSDGNAYAWGNGYKLGTAVTDKKDSLVPVRVATPDGVSITQVSAGARHSLAVDTDGNAYAWGFNSYGKLGDGTTDYRQLPVRVRGIVVAGGSDSVVERVTFGGVPSIRSPRKESDGTWSVLTPAHARGPVDVAVTWSLDGVEQVTHLQYTYTQETHTVTFCPIEDDPSPCSTQTVYDGERALRPTDPVRVDYVFDGWFDKVTNTAYDFGQPVTEDMTIVGHWTHVL